MVMVFLRLNELDAVIETVCSDVSWNRSQEDTIFDESSQLGIPLRVNVMISPVCNSSVVSLSPTSNSIS